MLVVVVVEVMVVEEEDEEEFSGVLRRAAMDRGSSDFVFGSIRHPFSRRSSHLRVTTFLRSFYYPPGYCLSNSFTKFLGLISSEISPEYHYIANLIRVWFQNRRTKWRKKNAAEMATAKRRQEEVEGIVAEGEDGCSDAEADGSSETAAKRLRRELEQQYRH
ncbi:homeobox protein Nkx-62-like [Vespula maculifrons]|uniref:Homeobox protein Nkx-62-like n=1 Tax=Vespula maculifrons TaxID=7453 RepID=A0ABD2CNT7_VESMC